MHRAEIAAADLLELEDLTREERRRWARAVLARHPVRGASSALSTGLASLTLFLLFCCAGALIVALVWFVAGSWIGSPFAYPGNMIVAAVIAVCIGLSIWTTAYFTTRHRDVEARQRLAARLYIRPACAGCDYDLSAVEPLPGRPSVIRCPECGLINPAPLYDPPHASR
ncbi:MAG: hypothetical protein IT436_15120 [Phycisphaerales bacterium]|nr:hypothetical protein [Phycisphaerales bacterium]